MSSNSFYDGKHGARKVFGPSSGGAASEAPAHKHTDGVIREIAVDFTYDCLPVKGNAGADAVIDYIPANSLILSSYLYIYEDFTSTSTTTDLTIGLQEADGTEIDDDGLHTAAQLTQTAIDASNVWFVGGGALIGSSDADNGYITVTPTVDDLLTGAARLVVRYILPDFV